jgi:hypothetical protein
LYEFGIPFALIESEEQESVVGVFESAVSVRGLGRVLYRRFAFESEAQWMGVVFGDQNVDCGGRLKSQSET